MPKITPHLWFDDQAEDAARFQTSLFRDSTTATLAPRSPAGASGPS